MTPDEIPQRLVELGAEALRRAAYECDGDCGLPEDECWTRHPVNWSAMVVGETHVHGSTEALARTVLAGAASAGGFEWLATRERDAGAVTPRWRAKAARQLAIAARAAVEAVSVLGLAFFALWVSDWAQREADSRAVGWLAGFGVVLGPFAALGAWRHRMRPGRWLFDRAFDAATSGRRSTAWLTGVPLVLFAFAVPPRRSARLMRSLRRADERVPAPEMDPEWSKR